LPARQPSSLALRVLAALTGIVGLELIRYFSFSSEYKADPSLWFVIAGSIAFNIWFQWWTPSRRGVEGADRCGFTSC
jgi:hypothetical protein